MCVYIYIYTQCFIYIHKTITCSKGANMGDLEFFILFNDRKMQLKL